MKKPRPNEACPCGSTKKYKRCCGAAGAGATPGRRGDAGATWLLAGEAHARGDVRGRDALCRAAAEAGHLEAQCMYGNVLSERGDLGAALSWWGRAAKAGALQAQLRLGDLHRKAEGGVGRDLDAAARWYRLAAAQGNARAMWSLGRTLGTKGDLPGAFGWYQRAAELQLAEAQHSLGVCYRDGEGVTADQAAAAECFRLAAEQNHAAAQSELGNLYACGAGGVGRDVSAALAWRRRAAEQGDPKAMYNLSLMPEVDWGERIALLRRAIETVEAAGDRANKAFYEAELAKLLAEADAGAKDAAASLALKVALKHKPDCAALASSLDCLRLHRTCAACGVRADERKLKACQACKVAWYCCVGCQREHWPAHRGECPRLAAERRAARKWEGK